MRRRTHVGSGRDALTRRGLTRRRCSPWPSCTSAKTPIQAMDPRTANRFHFLLHWAGHVHRLGHGQRAACGTKFGKLMQYPLLRPSRFSRTYCNLIDGRARHIAARCEAPIMDRSLRESVLRRDRFACRACGRKTRGQVHHVIERRLGGSDDPTNLVTLCGTCHMLVSPITVSTLTTYFGINESELLVRRSRVQAAINALVLSKLLCTAGPLRSSRSRISAAAHARSLRPTIMPEWRRLRPRAGRSWEPDEDASLLAEHEAGLPLAEIAARRGRGVFAVEVRLHKLKNGAAPS